ncbi:hypothetical protein GQ53DRAFT_838393 [Thozetella sp. PMI_491]|nr:hypothetical protein GQ53DRAFT_838393 [Thozetella sp. PMI_491]
MFRRAAKSLGGILASGQWTDALLRLSQQRNELRHAVLAVGALHSSRTVSERQWATQNYTVAIRCLGDQQLTPQSFGAMLAGWVLCAAFELMLRNIGRAISHIQSAISLVAQRPSLLHSAPDTYIPTKPVIGTLGALETALCRMTGHIPRLTLRQESGDAFSAPFRSLESARKALQLVWHGLGVLNHHVSRLGTPMSNQSYSDFMSNHHDLAEALKLWKPGFDDLKLRSGQDEQTRCAMTLLTIQYESALQYASGLVEAQELRWDQLHLQFERILDLAEEVITTDNRPLPALSTRCTLDYGVVPALFYVAWKCRHAALRLRAIEILETHPRIEGLWDSILCARLGRYIDRVERGMVRLHDAAARNDSADIIGEVTRVLVISINITTERREARIGLMTTHDMVNGLSHCEEEKWNW